MPESEPRRPSPDLEDETGVRPVTVKLQDVTPPDTVKPVFNEVHEARQDREILTTDSDYYRYLKDADVRAPGPARAAR